MTDSRNSVADIKSIHKKLSEIYESLKELSSFEKRKKSLRTIAALDARWILNNVDSGYKRVWISNSQPAADTSRPKDVIIIPKNARLAYEILTKGRANLIEYEIKDRFHPTRPHKNHVDIFSQSLYDSNDGTYANIGISWHEADRELYDFGRLEELRDYIDKLYQFIREEEIKAKTEKEKEESLKRIAAYEAQLQKARLEKARNELNANYLRSSNDGMRVQDNLDRSQILAKTSHIYDRVPIVIQGGPGTGKTTTAIQRLKFLLSDTLKDYSDKHSLTDRQIDIIIDDSTVNDHWIYISPTELLCQFVKSVLSAEGLSTKDKNVMTFKRFLSQRTSEYFKPAKDGAKPSLKALKATHECNEKTLFTNEVKAYTDFDSFLTQALKDLYALIITIKSGESPWREVLLPIQAICKTGLDENLYERHIRILSNLYLQFGEKMKEFKLELDNKIIPMADRLNEIIRNDEEKKNRVIEVLSNFSINQDNPEEEDDEEEEDDVTEIAENDDQVDAKIYSKLKSLVKRIALVNFNKNLKLSKRDTALFEIIRNDYNHEDIEALASFRGFVEYCSKVCSGVEALMIKPIPNEYKKFRRQEIKKADSLYDKMLIASVMKMGPTFLHFEEQVLVLCHINSLIRALTRDWKDLTSTFKDTIWKAYNKSTKNVICIDEASDYSPMDLKCIASFADPVASSVTLVGDMMQKLNSRGINDWEQLKEYAIPNLEIITLKKSYRQHPVLLKVSRAIYEEEMHEPAPYTSGLKNEYYAPKPFAFVSEDEDEKIDWIANQISSIHSHYEEFPSIAIFINDDQNPEEFIEALGSHPEMQELDIHDGTSGAQGRSDVVRVFRLSQVKGMEFEIGIFHNIDLATADDESLLRRYLYVGISRARSMLGATFNSPDNSNLKYFTQGDIRWPK